MTKYAGYHVVRVGKISQSKLKKAAMGGAINLSKDELEGNQALVLHPENAKKVEAAKKAKRGTRMIITPGEIEHDIRYHEQTEGGSLWDTVKSGLKWLGTQALDGIAAGGKEILGDSKFANAVVDTARNGIRNLTGLGVSGGKLVKGSGAAKERMAKLRSMKMAKRSGGSFRL
jgi:hypothetical protein